ncbi:Stf0 family sulfotransferase [Paenibacillus spongiae]|uniref:Stf0 family sulfotransferase n=1 Tax=Paenibacillus spongiae TaxID=2909671 RepID=A0ABY5S656_9BACL|nr:Stf0 family sulfotransferase [Paenibacillus spongiae]UVI29391.1 Stf0 family sulfotransferase [Paenibacillus spongiae]
MKPNRSYTIWFAQRTGSTLLSQALASTGVAGNPADWLEFHVRRDQSGMEQLNHILESGTSANGVFGMKHSPNRNDLEQWLSWFQKELQLPEGLTRPRIWESVFPNCRHIYMTRRNKVRLAVSWWRAIVSGEWHREHGAKPKQADTKDRYSLDAINHLIQEAVMRESWMAEFFAEERITPLTVVYEDFILDYEGTVRGLLKYLEIPEADNVTIAPPYYDGIADDIAEEWVQRYREERQKGWTNVAW